MPSKNLIALMITLGKSYGFICQYTVWILNVLMLMVNFSNSGISCLLVKMLNDAFLVETQPQCSTAVTTDRFDFLLLFLLLWEKKLRRHHDAAT